MRTPRRVKNEERIILLGMMQGMKNKGGVALGRNVSESPGMPISDGASIWKRHVLLRKEECGFMEEEKQVQAVWVCWERSVLSDSG